jgi:hypothetical protein
MNDKEILEEHFYGVPKHIMDSIRRTFEHFLEDTFELMQKARQDEREKLQAENAELRQACATNANAAVLAYTELESRWEKLKTVLWSDIYNCIIVEENFAKTELNGQFKEGWLECCKDLFERMEKIEKKYNKKLSSGGEVPSYNPKGEPVSPQANVGSGKSGVGMPKPEKRGAVSKK